MLSLLFVDVSSLFGYSKSTFFHFIVFFSELTSDFADLYILCLLSITLFPAVICIISSSALFGLILKLVALFIKFCMQHLKYKDLAAPHKWAKLMQPLSSHKF